jgi:hypothetical protein
MMGGRIALLLSVLSCLLSVPVPASRPISGSTEFLPRLEPIPESFFGLHIILDNWPTVSFSDIRSSGVSWSKLEPSRGQFNWSVLDRQVSRAIASGKKFYYSTGGVPKWWAGTSNIQDFDDFVTALATRYKGKIEAYELWNEPDQDETISHGPMSDIVLITRHMHDDIRRIDPDALIASPAVVRISWMDGYWGAGGVRDIDVVALHGYPTHNPAAPEIIGSQKALPMISLWLSMDYQQNRYGTRKHLGVTAHMALPTSSSRQDSSHDSTCCIGHTGSHVTIGMLGTITGTGPEALDGALFSIQRPKYLFQQRWPISKCTTGWWARQ